MSSLLSDIETTLEDGNQYVMENWYWNTFLPVIDQLNILTDYHYIYRDFNILDAINKGLQLIESKEVTLQWLCDNGKARVSRISYMMDDMCYKLEDMPVYVKPGREILLTFEDEFYWDIQKISLGSKGQGTTPHSRYTNNFDYPITFKCGI